MKVILTLLLLWIFIPNIFGQADTPAGTMVDRIVDYYKKVPQEKIYIHTDRSYYATGDSLWFRAYLVDALSNVPLAESRYVFIELHRIEGNDLIDRAMIMCDSAGVFSNVLSLSPDLTEGEYSLSAYTEWMRNFGSEQFFSKKIRIINPFAQVTTDSIPVRRLDTIDLAIMPEGGNLLSGIMQRVAFKALGNDGYGVDVDVRVVREDGDIILETKSLHLGMGYFTITPQAGEQLYAEAYTRERLSKRVPLPVPVCTGVSLSVSQFRDSLLIQPVLTADVDTRRLALVIYGRQNVVEIEEIKSDNPLIRVPVTSLNEGVVTIALIDKELNEVLAERMVYIRGNGAARVAIQTDGETHAKRSPVKLTLDMKDEEGKSLPGKYSLAVTDAKSGYPDSLQANIESYLLLSSDIKGHVEQPNHYFLNVNPATDRALDLLMLTQGWRRYDLSNMLKGQYPEITYSFQQHQTISGEVRGTLFGKARDTKIMLAIPNEGYLTTYALGDSSRFRITDLAFVDGVEFILEATNKHGSSTFMKLEVDSPTFPEYIPSVFSVNRKQEVFVNEQFYAHSRERMRYINGVPEIELAEVVVAARKVVPALNSFKIEPDRVLPEGDHALKFSSTIESLISRLGLRIKSEEGVNSMAPMRPTLEPPTLFIDNFREEHHVLWDIPATDVKQMELIRPGNAGGLAYGTDVMINGALMVFLKDGSEIEKTRNYQSMKNVRQMGYKPFVEFYSPRYPTQPEHSVQTSDLRTTLFWSPDVVVGDSGVVTVDFYTTDDPGNFYITIEGLSDSGRVVRECVTGQAQQTVITSNVP